MIEFGNDVIWNGEWDNVRFFGTDCAYYEVPRTQQGFVLCSDGKRIITLSTALIATAKIQTFYPPYIHFISAISQTKGEALLNVWSKVEDTERYMIRNCGIPMGAKIHSKNSRCELRDSGFICSVDACFYVYSKPIPKGFFLFQEERKL